jgi:hypothetical protein
MPSASAPKFEASAYDREAGYGTVAAWWRGHGTEPLPIRSSPRIGIWAEKDGVRHGAAFAYQTTADLLIMAFPIADPALSWRQQAEALSFAVAALHAALRAEQPESIIISLSHEAGTHQIYVNRAGFRGTGKTWLGVSAPAGVDLDILTE